MIIIPDSSPLISLAILDKLDLLKVLSQEVIIPSKVIQEISVIDKNHSQKIKSWSNGLEKSCENINAYNAYRLILDSGESECLVLSKEVKNSVLILDDKKARKIAESEKLNYVGTIGILLKARKENLIKDIKPLLEKLIQEDIYISRELYEKALNIQKSF